MKYVRTRLTATERRSPQREGGRRIDPIVGTEWTEGGGRVMTRGQLETQQQHTHKRAETWAEARQQAFTWRREGRVQSKKGRRWGREDTARECWGGRWWGRYLCESSGACRWVRSLGVTLDSTAGQLEVTVSRCQQGELRVGQLRVYDRKWGNTPS